VFPYINDQNVYMTLESIKSIPVNTTKEITSKDIYQKTLELLYKKPPQEKQRKTNIYPCVDFIESEMV
jgi:hypothetical protein